jgi:hypothetical protein
LIFSWSFLSRDGFFEDFIVNYLPENGSKETQHGRKECTLSEVFGAYPQNGLERSLSHGLGFCACLTGFKILRKKDL